ncbi:uncharacterized protein EDB93DRAFT_1262596 [Suillus bovinus]|uniref:uncharacterized protein n=1 Tax=Suillus bovinus TaxID=48563 RepID=UPI001B8712D1|nr:uncharacterized protein EDB93DRAFT_1262596 [Suillus bovinus]KAG2155881.1 hypothetical protein EDB93DRAFT_1262596 [Suillus bovinus]
MSGLTPSSTQTVEALAVFTTLRHFQYTLSRLRTIATVANAEAGPIRTTPSSLIGKIITPIHALSVLTPPVTYILCVTFNRLAQPAWMLRMSLSNTYFTHEIEVGLRVAACAATFVLNGFTRRAFTHLGNQWHLIGRREKSRIVQTGPYAIVRHPLYTSVLIQGLLFTLMTWSYAPLVGSAIATGLSAVKLLVEEDLILQDPAVAGEYRAYMQKVPARLIPFLW